MTVSAHQRPVTSDPVAEFAKIPGLGPHLAQRIAQQLRIQTLEQLELAAHTGRLQTVDGIGPGRARQVRQAVAEMLDSRQRSRQAPPVSDSSGGTANHESWKEPLSRGPRRLHALQRAPKVVDILLVDREYRRRARARTLPMVAPRRFNPTHQAFLPVYRIERGGVQFTAFYSNTPTANAVGKTHDWVIVIARLGATEHQYTVVTETRGRWFGQRVVRGREAECRELYGLDAA